jgi:hypothetical protein
MIALLTGMVNSLRRCNLSALISLLSIRMMAHIVAGEKGWDYDRYSSASEPDMLAHSKDTGMSGKDMCNSLRDDCIFCIELCVQKNPGQLLSAVLGKIAENVIFPSDHGGIRA